MCDINELRRIDFKGRTGIDISLLINRNGTIVINLITGREHLVYRYKHKQSLYLNDGKNYSLKKLVYAAFVDCSTDFINDESYRYICNVDGNRDNNDFTNLKKLTRIEFRKLVSDKCRITNHYNYFKNR